MLKSAREKTDYCLDLVEQYKNKKGYKAWNRIHREPERMMDIVEFHFYDAHYNKKEVLTFTSYEEMINTLTEKIKAKDDD
ncbi:hypothetical protein HpVa144_15930 [Helicobacter pylori]